MTTINAHIEISAYLRATSEDNLIDGARKALMSRDLTASNDVATHHLFQFLAAWDERVKTTPPVSERQAQERRNFLAWRTANGLHNPPLDEVRLLLSQPAGNQRRQNHLRDALAAEADFDRPDDDPSEL